MADDTQVNFVAGVRGVLQVSPDLEAGGEVTLSPVELTSSEGLYGRVSPEASFMVRGSRPDLDLFGVFRAGVGIDLPWVLSPGLEARVGLNTEGDVMVAFDVTILDADRGVNRLADGFTIGSSVIFDDKPEWLLSLGARWSTKFNVF